VAENWLHREYDDDQRDAVRNLLESHAGWDILMEALEGEARGYRDQILRGDLDLDRYHRYAGLLQGFSRVQEIAEAIVGQAPGGPE